MSDDVTRNLPEDAQPLEGNDIAAALNTAAIGGIKGWQATAEGEMFPVVEVSVTGAMAARKLTEALIREGIISEADRVSITEKTERPSGRNAPTTSLQVVSIAVGDINNAKLQQTEKRAVLQSDIPFINDIAERYQVAELIDVSKLEAYAAGLRENDRAAPLDSIQPMQKFKPELSYVSAATKEAFEGGAPTPQQVTRALYELAFYSAQQGGFFSREKTADSGRFLRTVKKMDSTKMAEAVRQIRELKLMPGIDITLDEDGRLEGKYLDKLREIFDKHEVLYSHDRLKFVREFADPERYKAVEALAEKTLESGNGKYRFTMETVEKLAEIFPLSLGADPLRKKAALTVVLAGGLFHHHAPELAETTSILPMDYQVPRGMEAKGMLNLSGSPEGRRLKEKLRQSYEKVLHEDDPDMMRLRAASGVAADAVRRLSGKPMEIVDAELWLSGRELSKASQAVQDEFPMAHVLPRQGHGSHAGRLFYKHDLPDALERSI